MNYTNINAADIARDYLFSSIEELKNHLQDENNLVDTVNGKFLFLEGGEAFELTDEEFDLLEDLKSE